MKEFTTYLSVCTLFFLLAGISAAVSGSLCFGQPPGPGEGRPPDFGPGTGMAGGPRVIGKLVHSLDKAGAEPLLPEEEEAIVNLLREHWENRPAPDQERPENSPHAEYANAILHGGDVEYWAGEVAQAMAERTQAHLLARAELQTGLLEILGEERKNQLISEFGEEGVFRILSGPGRMGHFGKGRGGGAKGFSRGPMRFGPRGDTMAP